MLKKMVLVVSVALASLVSFQIGARVPTEVNLPAPAKADWWPEDCPGGCCYDCYNADAWSCRACFLTD